MTPVPTHTRCDHPRTKVIPWAYRRGAVCVLALSRSRFPKPGENPLYRLARVTTNEKTGSGWVITGVDTGETLHLGNDWNDVTQETSVYRAIAIVGRPATLRSRALWEEHEATTWDDIDAVIKSIEPFMEALP